MPQIGARKAASASVGRARSLERNRVAATKCRRRKNVWQANLESKKAELESRYSALRSETEELTEEVAQLKNLIMAHAFCNDANIDNWIQAQAQNLQRSGVSATTGTRASTTSSSTTGSKVPQSALVAQLSPSSGASSTGQKRMSEQALNSPQDWTYFDTIPPMPATNLESLLNATTYPSLLQQPADHVNPAFLTTSLVGAGFA